MAQQNTIRETISTPVARRIYDHLGKRYDWFGLYDSRAKEHALQLLDLEPGQIVLDIGTGTGKEHARIQSTISPNGIAYGLDISSVMLTLTRRRAASPLCIADARQLPFAFHQFDRLYTAYVLDLLPLGDLPKLLEGCLHVLKPGGRMVIAALTEGITLSSRALVAAWKLTYSISPVACAGCRPLQLADFVKAAGFNYLQREVIVQWGVPSEILAAQA